MRLGIVTSNEHKFREISRILRGMELKMLPAEKIEIQVDSTSPEALDIVALISAAFARRNHSPPFAVEDTGLFIRALNLFPGVYSHYAKDTIGPEGILKLMKGKNDRYAEFRTTVALVTRDRVILFRGKVKGQISMEIRGTNGFGFDPIFEYNGKTFAEMSIDEKNSVSHRGKAWKGVLKWFQENGSI